MVTIYLILVLSSCDFSQLFLSPGLCFWQVGYPSEIVLGCPVVFIISLTMFYHTAYTAVVSFFLLRLLINVLSTCWNTWRRRGGVHAQWAIKLRKSWAAMTSRGDSRCHSIIIRQESRWIRLQNKILNICVPKYLLNYMNMWSRGNIPDRW